MADPILVFWGVACPRNQRRKRASMPTQRIGRATDICAEIDATGPECVYHPAEGTSIRDRPLQNTVVCWDAPRP